MAASAHLKPQTQTQTQTKPKRRKQHQEITISTFASPAPDQPKATTSFFPVPTYPASYANFNSALTAGLLNPMSPPPPHDKTRSSPALFDMMSHELNPNPNPNPKPTRPVPIERQLLLEQRIAEILDGDGPFNDQESSDVRLTLTSKDFLTFSLDFHRHVLASNSRFFAARLPDRSSKHHLVEISDCEDIEIYVETLSLMYCNDLRRRLMKADVGRVLEILKVSAAIAFDAGVVSCLEHLEAAPWTEDEEEKVASLLSQLNLDGAGAGEVLKRVSLEVATSSEEAIVTRLIKVVLEGKDEKARREMKALMAKMLRGNSRGSGDILSEESLYSACNCCIQQLHHHFAGASDASDSAPQISRQADNLHWILDILIDRRIADEFLRIWAAQTELAELLSKVPALHRYEVSQVTARLFVAIGQGQILVCRETRCLLLRTWLETFYEDFGWMRRAFKGIDRHSIEDGLGSTILTLPMIMQQEILMDWFHRFLNLGDDCPNMQRGFEVWWRRAFWRRSGEREQLPQLRIAAACDNSC